jgi:hypothetical protein
LDPRDGIDLAQLQRALDAERPPKMKGILLGEWTGLLDRIKTRFSRADLDDIDPQIRAALIELARF